MGRRTRAGRARSAGAAPHAPTIHSPTRSLRRSIARRNLSAAAVPGAAVPERREAWGRRPGMEARRSTGEGGRAWLYYAASQRGGSRQQAADPRIDGAASRTIAARPPSQNHGHADRVRPRGRPSPTGGRRLSRPGRHGDRRARPASDPQRVRHGVAGVAAVLGVYAVVLAPRSCPPSGSAGCAGIRATRPGRSGPVRHRVARCAAWPSGIALLLVGRAVQALGGAALLVTAHAILVGDRRRATGQTLTLWRQAALLGMAAGPAIGGALTQGFGWRSIFLIQVPAALAAVPGCLTAPGAAAPRRRASRPAAPLQLAALALVSGRHRGGALPHGAHARSAAGASSRSRPRSW